VQEKERPFVVQVGACEVDYLGISGEQALSLFADFEGVEARGLICSSHTSLGHRSLFR
jgi:hypothetical protein